jgi:hypothetical protein
MGTKDNDRRGEEAIFFCPFSESLTEKPLNIPENTKISLLQPASPCILYPPNTQAGEFACALSNELPARNRESYY